MASCASEESEPSPTAATAPALPDGYDGRGLDCGELFTLADAEELFGGPVERVEDAVEQGLITASAIPPSSEVCYYRPTRTRGRGSPW